MWFQFPEGVTEISVMQMNFKAEFEDKAGNAYFRAPDHFAPTILALPKFKSVADMPEGAPTDLTPPDTLRDTTISQLAAENAGLKLENEQLQAALASFKAQNEDLKLEVYNLKNELETKGVEDEAEAPKLGSGGKK